MQRLGSGKCVVVIISKPYLESESCMFELVEIARHGDMDRRVFPLVLADAKIHDTLGCLTYVEFWERKKAELDARIKTVSSEGLGVLREQIDLCELSVRLRSLRC